MNTAPNQKEPAKVKRLKETLPHIWEFIRPRRGILALGFVMVIINRLAGLVLPASSKYLIDNVIGKRQVHLLEPLILAVVGATVIQGITSFGLTQVLSKEAQRLIAELRRQVQQHVGRLPIAFYDSNKTGALVSRIMSDVEGLRNLIGTGLVQFVGGVLTAIFALFILLHISVFMTLIAITVLAAFSLSVKKAFAFIRPIFRERRKIHSEVTGRLTESLGGVRVVKGYHAEDREHEVFSAGVERLLNNVLKTLTATSVMDLSATVLLGVVSAIIMLLGAHRILSGTMTLGTFVTYTLFLGFLLVPVVQIVGIGLQLTEAVAGLDRTREILGESPEDEDPWRTVELGAVQGEVKFEGVSFSYDGKREVLQEVSFSAAPGTVTALVGPSGAGKSTVIGLLAAFYRPTSGKVLIDGVDLSSARLNSYRTQLGVVLQETFLFDGTIRENVMFSKPGATEERLLAACRMARVDEFAEKLAEGYNTVVGERGVKLSGGQKQRVSIARAILADPRILVLDEATSSLDSESEAMIQEGLSFLMRGRTTFVIAHRLSTIRSADQILVMEGGRIIECGNHETLYAARGRYWELYTKQYGLESNRFMVTGEDADGSGAAHAVTAEISEIGAESEVDLPGPMGLIRAGNR
jgi:ABC-type multidrug transport system fused ATPase/permease subunit